VSIRVENVGERPIGVARSMSAISPVGGIIEILVGLAVFVALTPERPAKLAIIVADGAGSAVLIEAAISGRGSATVCGPHSQPTRTTSSRLRARRLWSVAGIDHKFARLTQGSGDGSGHLDAVGRARARALTGAEAQRHAIGPWD